MRLAGSDSEAGAANKEGCSAQYEENSVREVVLRMNGGAVIEERSPLNEAIDCRHISNRALFNTLTLALRKDDHDPLACAGTAAPSPFEASAELDILDS